MLAQEATNVAAPPDSSITRRLGLSSQVAICKLGSRSERPNAPSHREIEEHGQTRIYVGIYSVRQSDKTDCSNARAQKKDVVSQTCTYLDEISIVP